MYLKLDTDSRIRWYAEQRTVEDLTTANLANLVESQYSVGRSWASYAYLWPTVLDRQVKHLH